MPPQERLEVTPRALAVCTYGRVSSVANDFSATRLVSANIHATSDSTGKTRCAAASPKVVQWPVSSASSV